VSICTDFYRFHFFLFSAIVSTVLQLLVLPLYVLVYAFKNKHFNLSDKTTHERKRNTWCSSTWKLTRRSTRDGADAVEQFTLASCLVYGSPSLSIPCSLFSSIPPDTSLLSLDSLCFREHLWAGGGQWAEDAQWARGVQWEDCRDIGKLFLLVAPQACDEAALTVLWPIELLPLNDPHESVSDLSPESVSMSLEPSVPYLNRESVSMSFDPPSPTTGVDVTLHGGFGCLRFSVQRNVCIPPCSLNEWSLFVSCDVTGLYILSRDSETRPVRTCSGTKPRPQAGDMRKDLDIWGTGTVGLCCWMLTMLLNGDLLGLCVDWFEYFNRPVVVWWSVTTHSVVGGL